MSIKETKNKTDYVASIILAGGLGTRLFPLTQTRCKPAVGFGGKFRLIDVPISNSLNAGIANIFVISQYFSSCLYDHIICTYHFDTFRHHQIKLLTPEEHPLSRICFEGSGDAVRKNLEELLKTNASYFLILCGDQVYNMDFQKLIEFAKEKDADLVIASMKIEEKEAQRMGVLKIDQKQRVLDFFEKPKKLTDVANFALIDKKTTHFLGSLGIYVFKREALISLLKEKGDDFGMHLIPIQIKKGGTFTYTYDGYWVDIGTIASFYQSNLDLLSCPASFEVYNEESPIYARPKHIPSALIKNSHIENSLISEGSIIESSHIDHSVIGLRSCIKAGTKIDHSILIGNPCYAPQNKFSIGENCLIKNSIIDEEVHIGNHVKLVNKKKLTTFDGDGVYIRDGIIIVATGAHIPDNFEL